MLRVRGRDGQFSGLLPSHGHPYMKSLLRSDARILRTLAADERRLVHALTTVADSKLMSDPTCPVHS